MKLKQLDANTKRRIINSLSSLETLEGKERSNIIEPLNLYLQEFEANELSDEKTFEIIKNDIINYAPKSPLRQPIPIDPSLGIGVMSLILSLYQIYLAKKTRKEKLVMEIPKGMKIKCKCCKNRAKFSVLINKYNNNELTFFRQIYYCPACLANITD